MAPEPARALAIESRPLRLVRLQAQVPRFVALVTLGATCAVGLRTLVRPYPTAHAVQVRPVAGPNLRSEAFAEDFARAYLTWDARRPDAHDRAMARYVARDLDAGAGFRPPPRGRQTVRWTRAIA